MELQLEPDGSCLVSSFYEPLPKQEELHVSPAKYLLAIGGNYSGKSATLLGEALYNIFEYPGCQCLLLRKNFPELEKGLIRDFLDSVPRELFRWNDSKKIATFFNGAKLFFGHCKSGSERDLAQYLSSAFVFIGIDELGQFSFSAWNFLSSRNRVNRGCRPNEDGNLPFCRMMGASNPMGPHYGWIRRAWIEKRPVSELGKTYQKEGDHACFYQETHGGEVVVFDRREYHFVHSTILDNPYALERDPDAIVKLQRLAPALRQKALYGDLNTIAGTYFQNFTRQRCVIELPKEHNRIRWESWQNIWISIDWGLAHHAVVYWHRKAKVLMPFKDEKKQDVWKTCVITYRELYVNETSHRELCKQIAQVSGITASDSSAYKDFGDERPMIKFCFLSPERFARQGDPDATKTIAHEMGVELKHLGLPRPTRANARRIDGAVFMYNLVDADEWYITDNCDELINAMETRVREEKTLEDVQKVADLGDDCYDAARYGLLSMLSEKSKPEEVAAQERIAKIEDPIARRVASYEEWLRSKEKGKKDGAFKRPTGRPTYART